MTANLPSFQVAYPTKTIKQRRGKQLITYFCKIVGLIVINAYENDAIISQQFPGKSEPRIHHGAPIAVIAAIRVGIRLVRETCLFLVILDCVAELVLVDKVMPRVIRRVDIDHLDLAVVAALQQLQHLEVVALDIDVVGVEGAILAITAAALFYAGAQCGGAYGLRLADGVGLAGPRERIALLALVDLVAKFQPQFVEVDPAFGEHLGHQFLELAQAVVYQVQRCKVHLLDVSHCRSPLSHRQLPSGVALLPSFPSST